MNEEIEWMDEWMKEWMDEKNKKWMSESSGIRSRNKIVTKYRRENKSTQSKIEYIIQCKVLQSCTNKWKHDFITLKHSDVRLIGAQNTGEKDWNLANLSYSDQNQTKNVFPLRKLCAGFFVQHWNLKLFHIFPA